MCVCLSLYICMQGCGYSVIVSDMCLAVSGIGSKDAALSGELGLQALHLALGQRCEQKLTIKFNCEN